MAKVLLLCLIALQSCWLVCGFDDDSGFSIPCTCGVFLDSQISRGTLRREAADNPIFSYPIEDGENIPNNLKGQRKCTKKCVDLAMTYVHKGPELLCAAVPHDIFKQKVHLYIKNGADKWINTKLNSGREFTCKDGEPA